MPVETPTTNGRIATRNGAEVVGPERHEHLRTLAIERIYRLRRFKLHLLTFALGVPILAGVWVLSEYYEEHTWPSRFASAPDVAGTWDPWFFWFAGIWAIILGVHALRTYFGPPIGPIGQYIRRPIATEQLDREVERLRSRY